jgi:hypothetical protein
MNDHPSRSARSARSVLYVASIDGTTRARPERPRPPRAYEGLDALDVRLLMMEDAGESAWRNDPSPEEMQAIREELREAVKRNKSHIRKWLGLEPADSKPEP